MRGPRPHFSPLEMSSSSTTPLAPSLIVTSPSESLRGDGHEYAGAFAKRGLHFGPPHDLRKMRRADLLFAFGHENKIHGQLSASAADGVQRGEERRFRPFLVDGAAPDEDFADAGLVDERGVQRRRRPFRGIDLFDVVHEIEAHRARRAGIERGENAGLAVGGILVTAGSPPRAACCMVSSQPSLMPRFSAAMEGWRIQVCRRFTLSSWRLVISAVMASRSPAAAAGRCAASSTQRPLQRQRGTRCVEIRGGQRKWLARPLVGWSDFCHLSRSPGSPGLVESHSSANTIKAALFTSEPVWRQHLWPARREVGFSSRGGSDFDLWYCNKLQSVPGSDGLIEDGAFAAVLSVVH